MGIPPEGGGRRQKRVRVTERYLPARIRHRSVRSLVLTLEANNSIPLPPTGPRILL